MATRKVIHQVRLSKRWGGTMTSSLCGRLRTLSDGMNLSDVRLEVNCKFCIRQLESLDRRAVNEAAAIAKEKEAQHA